jgi:hypothetical protein
MIYILKIIAIEKEKERNIVLKMIIKMTKNDNPLTLLNHSFTNFPKTTKGIKLMKINSKGIISVNNNADIV